MNTHLKWLAAMALVAAASGAPAQDVQIQVTPTPEGLTGVLTRASLLLSLKDEETAQAQDYVAAARADYRRLLTGLYAQGYYGGSVSILIDGREASQIAPLNAPAVVNTVTIRVTPGPAFVFGQADLGPAPATTALPDSFTSGAPALSGAVRDAALAAVAGWRAEGYAKAAPASQSIVARHGSAELDVSVEIAPGPKLTFGALTPTGNDAVSTARILQIAGLPEGAVFSPEDVDQATQRLRRTGAFRAVKLVEAEDISAGSTLGIEAQLVEDAPRRLGYGIAFSSVDGLGLNGYWMHRNLLGGAENFRVEGEITGLGGETGGPDYRISTNFRRPGSFAPDYDLLLGATAEVLDEPDYQLEQVGLEVGITRIVNPEFSWQAALGLSAAHVIDDLGDRRYALLTLPMSAELDRRDVAVDARSGYYLLADVTPFVGFGDASTGVRLFGDGRVYRTFGEARPVTFALRGQFGSVIGPVAAAAPSDFLFHSGGGDTVRGQAYQSLGVDLGGGDSIGGLSFASLSAEARIKITDNIGLVGFADAGHVGAASLPLTDGDWHAGAGLGLRYDTGLGPIRLDLATPVTGPGAGKSVSIYVGIGQSF